MDLSFHPLSRPLSSKALQAYRNDAGWPPLPSPHKKSLRPGARQQWVSVASGNKQIGVALLEMAPPEFCHVSEYIILGKYRGLGVGRWFMARIEQYCNSHGIPRLFLEAGAGTQSFYESMLFSPDPSLPGMLKKDVNPLLPRMFLPRQA